ncbi:MAG TPA: lysophospholipid acyltransferase family protein, partial [Pseudomonadales bacterium]|nr:lysophospholipid acyltransferase family protein [Pseudomonadales bacterium]
MSTFTRRLLTLPLLFLITALLTLSLPLWLLLSWLAALTLPAARSAPRVFGFLTAYAWCESIGVLVSLWIWLSLAWRRGSAAGEQRWIDANYALQAWWCRSLKRATQWLFRLRFVVEGDDELDGDGVIMLPRHCSIGDTVLPVAFYNFVHDRQLRFVLKRELLFDPCLDIVGNRLPNYFADRSAQNTAREVEGVRALTRDLGRREGILIYPEGTRFTPAKREQILASLAAKGDDEALARTRRWTRVLPPRPGGTLALLEDNPGRDVVFCAHTGFEGSASFVRLFNGSWLDTVVRIRFWRVPFAEVPTT